MTNWIEINRLCRLNGTGIPLPARGGRIEVIHKSGKNIRKYKTVSAIKASYKHYQTFKAFLHTEK